MKRLQRWLVGSLFVGASLGVAGFLTGIFPVRWAGPVYLAIGSLIVLLAAPGAQAERHWSLIVAPILGLLGSLTWTVLLLDIRLPDPRELATLFNFPTVPDVFLPAWWPLAVIVPCALAILQGLLREPTGRWIDASGEGAWALPGRPMLFGLVLLVMGAVGTVFAGVTFFQKVAIVAPVFEELAKLGAALVFIRAMRLEDPISVYAVGALAGLAFGTMEHAVSYASEADLAYLSRVAFHVTSTGLSAVVFAALIQAKTEELAVRWLATGPSTVVHAANNVLAIVIGVLGVVVPTAGPGFVPPIGFLFSAGMVAAAIAVSLRPGWIADPLAGFVEEIRTERTAASSEQPEREPLG